MKRTNSRDASFTLLSRLRDGTRAMRALRCRHTDVSMHIHTHIRGFMHVASVTPACRRVTQRPRARPRNEAEGRERLIKKIP